MIFTRVGYIINLRKANAKQKKNIARKIGMFLNHNYVTLQGPRRFALSGSVNETAVDADASVRTL